MTEDAIQKLLHRTRLLAATQRGEKLTRDDVLQLLHSRELMVTSIPATIEGKVAFLGVYPMDPKSPDTIALLRRSGVSASDEPLYRVSAIEVDPALVESQDYPSEEDLSHAHDVVAIGDEDLRAKLNEFGVGLDQLDFPANTDYPL